MFCLWKIRRRLAMIGAAALAAAMLIVLAVRAGGDSLYATGAEGAYIKWVDFDVPASAMKEAIRLDTEAYETDGGVRLDWIGMLAYLGAKYGGKFSQYKAADLQALAMKLREGTPLEELAGGMKHFGYYREAYTAVLGGLVGHYETEREDGGWQAEYGLKAYSPIAKGYAYSDYDDFGTGRDYGYSRKHLGHDLMALTGTPVIAVESGVVEVLGWNQYGGWRIGIRSFDGRRYYYYAHLRQNRPFAEGLEAGQVVMAGDVIGYVGRTGYSARENVNGIKQSHLHFGLQLIFDESQKEGTNQIWIDLYELTKLLSARRSATERNDETKEHTRVTQTREAVPPDRFVPSDKPPQEPGGEAEAAATRDADATPQTPVESTGLPVLMYHDIFKDPARQQTYTMTPAQFEDDLKFLKNNGYRTVVVQDVIDYVEAGKPLPEKPVMLTFDDGHFNNVYYAEPLLKQYGMRAVMFVVGAYCERGTQEGEENPNYSYITWERLAKMAQEEVWDIQSHSWSMHEDGQSGRRYGAGRKAGESDEQYRAALREDVETMTAILTEVTGKRPLAFAYPYGEVDGLAEQVLREAGYKATFFSCTGKTALMPGRSDTLFLMRRLARTNRASAGRLLGWS